MDWTTIHSVTYPSEAYVIKPVLENEGFTVFLKDELTVQVDNFMSNAIGGIKIQVPRNEAEMAYDFLLEKELIVIPEKRTTFLDSMNNLTLKIPIVKSFSLLARLAFLVIAFIALIIVFIVFSIPNNIT